MSVFGSDVITKWIHASRLNTMWAMWNGGFRFCSFSWCQYNEFHFVRHGQYVGQINAELAVAHESVYCISTCQGVDIHFALKLVRKGNWRKQHLQATNYYSSKKQHDWRWMSILYEKVMMLLTGWRKSCQFWSSWIYNMLQVWYLLVVFDPIATF